MQTSLITLFVAAAALGQVTSRSPIPKKELEYQQQAFEQWWGQPLVRHLEDLPADGSVPDFRVPYSGHDYPDRAGTVIYSFAAFRGGMWAPSADTVFVKPAPPADPDSAQVLVFSNPRSDVEIFETWKVPQCQLLWQWREVKDSVAVAFSDDDHWLAACPMGPPAMVWLWSVLEGKPMAQWRTSQGLGRALAFAPGGHILATAGSDQVIRLWDTGHTHLPPRLLQGHQNPVDE